MKQDSEKCHILKLGPKLTFSGEWGRQSLESAHLGRSSGFAMVTDAIWVNIMTWLPRVHVTLLYVNTNMTSRMGR